VLAIDIRRMLPVGLMALIGFVGGASVAAHQDPAAPAATPATAASAAQPERHKQSATREAARPPLHIDPKAALVSDIHNKVVHFPLALGAAGAILLLLSYRWPQFGPGARLLLVAAALSAWVAVRSGHAQQADLEGGGLDLWLERHQDFGEWTAYALTLTALVALIKRARPVHWLFALVVLGLLSATGFLGGILAHPPL